MKIKKFYAVNFWSSNHGCTCGQAGKNGRFGLACDIKIFLTKKERDNFVDNTSNSQSFKYCDLYKTSKNLSKSEFYAWLSEQPIHGAEMDQY